jgi:methylthioribose-1-phosphate isomerase
MTREEILELVDQKFFTLRWTGEAVEMIDQCALPHRESYILVRTVDDMIRAIRTLTVRGAPAIGIAGAMGLCLALQEAEAAGGHDPDAHLKASAKKLVDARPTAVNLRWAVERTLRRWDDGASLGAAERKQAVIDEAETILKEDIAMCRAMGEHGQRLIPDGARVMTLCNAGALATGGQGTALSLMRAARRAGKTWKITACETRPLLQGARLTAWELMKDGFDVTLICDSAAGYLMWSGVVDAVVVGSDRVARSGDCANKIGTYTLSVLARAHAVPFYIAVPTSTLDPSTPDGRSIVIEERDPEEVTTPAGTRFAAPGVAARNPAFDVTPASNITKIITEKGVFDPPDVMRSLEA